MGAEQRSESGPPSSSRARLWENGYIESFNARLRDELLNGEIFYTLKEDQLALLIESWWHHYNAIRLNSSLGYRPTAPLLTIGTVR